MLENENEKKRKTPKISELFCFLLLLFFLNRILRFGFSYKKNEQKAPDLFTGISSLLLLFLNLVLLIFLVVVIVTNAF